MNKALQLNYTHTSTAEKYESYSKRTSKAAPYENDRFKAYAEEYLTKVNNNTR